jgi:hypothetical protein
MCKNVSDINQHMLHIQHFYRNNCKKGPLAQKLSVDRSEISKWILQDNSVMKQTGFVWFGIMTSGGLSSAG